jgi:hypothetical protein
MKIIFTKHNDSKYFSPYKLCYVLSAGSENIYWLQQNLDKFYWLECQYVTVLPNAQLTELSKE